VGVSCVVASTADKQDLNQRAAAGLARWCDCLPYHADFQQVKQRNSLDRGTRVSSVVKIVVKILSASELNRNVRSRGDVGSSCRRLLTRHATAYCFQFQAGILSGLHRRAHGLAYK
jgi:hypothetical protein